MVLPAAVTEPGMAAEEITPESLVEEPFTYLAGAAGTGKTFLARQLAERDDTILAATTGIAAINLGAVTINSVLGFYDTQSLQEKFAFGHLQRRLRGLRRMGIRNLVIDEVSMFAAEQLSVLVQAIEEIEKTKEYDAELEQVTYSDRNQGDRLKLLLVGDFAQLPPIKAPFAFEAAEWGEFEANTKRLVTVRRQGDQAFIQALHQVRAGRPTLAVDTLRPCITPKIDFNFKGTTIVAANDEVDRLNKLRHAQLPGDPFKWATTRSGEQQKDWVRLIPEVVEVKKGALVMILANRAFPKLDLDDFHHGYYYVNGDLATVIERTDTGIKVMLHRTFEEQTVIPVVREWKEPTGDKKNPYQVKGSVTYLPLRLAYATTVHKSQGLSLDEVQVSVASWQFNEPGMMYVALSRARTLAGLRIVGAERQFLGKCSVDPRVRNWV